MGRLSYSRRSVLAVTAGSTVAGVGLAQASESGSGQSGADSRHSFEILSGTKHATTVYETTAPASGPTVLVLGGVHGNEVAGYEAASQISNWEIDAGTLVTIPRANTVAIENRTRTNTDGIDLNRQFPPDTEPRTALARALWDVVLEYEPDIVIDLHESIGLYNGNASNGVGQAIFRSSDSKAVDLAAETVSFLNDEHVGNSELRFETGQFTPEHNPRGLLVHKAAREAGASAFLAETLSSGVDLETRVNWHTQLVEHLAQESLFPRSGELSAGSPPEDTDDSTAEPEADQEETPEETADADSGGEPPSAVIRTDPAGAGDLELDMNQVVSLDASESSAPDGEIVSYEWDLERDGTFDETGDAIDVSVSACGEFSVVLRVTDDAGQEATDEITLSTW